MIRATNLTSYNNIGSADSISGQDLFALWKAQEELAGHSTRTTKGWTFYAVSGGDGTITANGVGSVPFFEGVPLSVDMNLTSFVINTDNIEYTFTVSD